MHFSLFIVAPLLKFSILTGAFYRLDSLCVLFYVIQSGMLIFWTFGVGLVLGTPDFKDMVVIEGTAEIPTYYIDQYEYPNILGAIPLSGLSLDEAQGACASVDKRVCTAAEWRRACGGKAFLKYGYAEHAVSGVCHQSPAQNATHTSMMSDMDFLPSGTFPECKSPDGIVDMIGNVEEWVLDDWKGMSGMLEGGASYTHESYADCTGRYSRMPDYRLTTDQQIVSAGTRCCWSETPLTDTLIELDKKTRLTSSTQDVSYDSDNEVQLPHGGWMDRYEYPNQHGSMAKTGVTWFEAQRFCLDEGKRLCGVYEWEQACSAEGNAFSMGGYYVKGGCALELEGSLPSGTMESCHNSYGLQDMSGGVWEWTGSDFDAPILSVGLPEEMQSLSEIRGGSWMVGPQKGLCRPVDGYPVTSKNMAYEDLGFRCCRGREWVSQSLSWGSEGRCPDDMVRIGNFCMDQFEYPNQEAQTPKGSIRWSDALEECSSVGKRVCTEAEWTLACEGPEWKGYSYGSTYQSGICASKDSMSGGQLAKSGGHPACKTPDGVFDMTGNLWEWVALDTAAGGVLRGGGSMLSAGLGRCRSRAFIRDEDSTMIDVGTRCCLTPPQ